MKGNRQIVDEAIAALQQVKKLDEKLGDSKKISIAELEAEFANRFSEWFREYDDENPKLAAGRASHVFATMLGEMFDLPEGSGTDPYDVEMRFKLIETKKRVYIGPNGHYVKKG